MIVLIADSDPRKDVVGGIGVYASSLATHLSDVVFLGKVQFGKVKRKVPYKVSLVNKKPGQNNIMFGLNLCKIGKKISLPSDAIIHAQRPDWIIPFRKHPGKKIITLHGSHYKNLRLKKGVFAAFIYGFLERWSFKIADTIIAVDKENFNAYAKKYSFVKDKLVIVPVAIDTKKFISIPKSKVLKELSLSSKNKIFLFVGRLSKEKRVDEMIKNLKNETLLIAGSGSEEAYLRSLVGSKDVHFLGALGQDELVKYYNAADALLIFSTHEGLPTVALESLACGTPVISTKVGEMPHLIKNGKNGYLVNGLTFRKAMDSFLKVRDDMSKECRKTSLEYDWSKVVKIMKKGVYK